MKSKLLALIIISAVMAFYSLASMANSYVSGAYITAVDVRNDGTFLVSISADIINLPTCATEKNRMSANANSIGGKTLLAAVMSAFAQRKTVEIQGSEVCNEYGQIQSIFRIVQFQ